jgi:hypothetical protein
MLHMTLAEEMSREVRAMTDGAGATVSREADR